MEVNEKPDYDMLDFGTDNAMFCTKMLCCTQIIVKSFCHPIFLNIICTLGLYPCIIYSFSMILCKLHHLILFL